MSQKSIRYHYIVRMIGVLAIFLLMGFSDYNQNMVLFIGLAVFYIIYNTVARFSLFVFKRTKYHKLNLFFDVLMLTIAIATRGGLRSDFYLGYFLILGYALIIRDRNLLFQLSVWIIINYSLVVFLFCGEENVDYGRLIIRLTLLIGTSLLLHNYSKMLNDSETLRERAVKAAMFDSLTGAYNRRILKYLGEIYESEDIALYVSILDIDDFKHINDKYGHPKGDEVLVAMANVIQEYFEEKSICIRYGGEEFLLLLQSNNYSDVRTTIEGIQRRIKDEKFSWLEAEDLITFTAGISFKHEAEDINDTIERADIALYQGKTSGKNCIILN